MGKQNRWRRTVASFILAATGTGGAILADTSSASATDSGNCHFSWTNASGEATCPQASSFRVVIVCTHTGTPYTVYGQWARRYNFSTADCNLGDMLQSTGRPPSVYADVDTPN